MKIIAITPDRKRDYTTEQILEGLKSLGCEILASDAGNGIEKAVSEKQLLSENNIDAVIAFFGKVRDNRAPKHHLIKQLRETYPTAYVDGSEWTYTGYPLKNQIRDAMVDPKLRRGSPWLHEEMLKLTNAYFKRECYPEDMERGVQPLPFCMTKNHLIHSSDKDIDLMCVFGQTVTGFRKKAIEICSDIKSTTNYNIVIANNLNSEDYKKALSRSRIVIDAWGGGDCCDRFYEAIGAGACCFYQKYNVVVENPFLDFETAVEYEDEKTFKEKLRILLTSNRLSREIGFNGKEHALAYHTSESRAMKILKKLTGNK